MPRKSKYEKGDHVRYEGDLSIAEGILRKPDFGRIDDFEMSFQKERINLYLLTGKQNIWCDFENIREIFTNEALLEKLGFINVTNDSKKVYILKHTIISRIGIGLEKQYIDTGYCIGDLYKGFNTQNYLNNGGFDLEKFYSVYPSVRNINDLIKHLEINNLEVNIEKVLLE